VECCPLRNRAVAAVVAIAAAAAVVEAAAAVAAVSGGFEVRPDFVGAVGPELDFVVKL